MAIKQQFTPDEWTTILMSPTIAGMAITAADPSGLWGMLKESFASGAAVVEAKTSPGGNALVTAVVADFETAEGRTAIKEALKTRFAGSSPDDVVPQALFVLRDVSSILAAKAPDEAAGFREWLEGISLRVAEASKEGGFLGFGGVRVSDAEKATLDDIKRALSA